MIVKTHFQIEVFQFMVGQLCSRTSGPLVDRAWVVIEEIYRYHNELFKVSVKPNVSLGIVAIKSWKRREEAVRLATGTLPETPWYIARLRELLGSGCDSQDSASDTTASPSTKSTTVGVTPSSTEMPWDQMLGFVDSSSINWDMFGNAAQPAVNYGTYAAAGLGPYQTMNGWM